jgi:hypothetical protein
MVMEFEGTRWTSNNPAPFSRAPGGGRGLGEDISRRPRQAATTDFESGFAAEPADSEMVFSPQLVKAAKPFVVKKLPVAQGEVPAALVQFYLTDRGGMSQERFDTGVGDRLRAEGFVTSRASRFEPLQVSWKWERKDDFYFPVVSAPAGIAGLRYAGNAIKLPVYNPSSADLASLPTQLYVYTMAVTSAQRQMTDADAAKLLTVLTQTLSTTLSAAQAYAKVYVTLRGSDPAVFDGPKPGPTPIAKAGFYSVALILLYNLIGPHA